jgi:hypothetical protein
VQSDLALLRDDVDAVGESGFGERVVAVQSLRRLGCVG